MQSNIHRYLSKVLFCVVFALSATTGGNAQENPSRQQIQSVEMPQLRPVVLPGTHYEIIVGKGVFQSFTTPGDEALLTAIASWLSTNFDLPSAYYHPRIEFVPPLKMVALRYRGLTSDRDTRMMPGNSDAMPLNDGRDILAIYDDERRTIYLPEGWSGATPAELSVLVHEMVHHLQNVAGLKYNCPEEREKPAYTAQMRWLGLFGRNLSDEFQMDGLTILVRTNCMG